MGLTRKKVVTMISLTLLLRLNLCHQLKNQTQNADVVPEERGETNIGVNIFRKKRLVSDEIKYNFTEKAF